MDESDAAKLFLLRLTPSLEPIGTIRAFKAPNEAYYKLSCAAVLKDYRQYHFGRELVLAAHEWVKGAARADNDGIALVDLVIYSQASAKGFYAKFGYEPEGQELSIDGGPHQKMVRWSLISNCWINPSVLLRTSSSTSDVNEYIVYLPGWVDTPQRSVPSLLRRRLWVAWLLRSRRQLASLAVLGKGRLASFLKGTGKRLPTTTRFGIQTGDCSPGRGASEASIVLHSLFSMDKAASGSGLSSIPVELLTRIFKLLHYKDLRRCSMVCRHVHSIVEDVAKKQYSLELAMNGLVECALEQPLPVFARLHTLFDHRSRWRSLDWFESERPIPEDVAMDLLDFSSGVFVQPERSKRRNASYWYLSLRITYLHEGDNSMTEHMYNTGIAAGVLSDGEHVSVERVLVQPLADLIVIVTFQRSQLTGGNLMVYMYLRTLTSGGCEPYCLDQIQYAPCTQPSQHIQNLKASLDWDLISIATDIDDVGRRYTIWNYKTGKMVIDMSASSDNHEVHSISLVTPTSFVALRTRIPGTDMEPEHDSIDIYSFDPTVTRNVTLDASLRLPQRKTGTGAKMDVTAGRFSPRTPTGYSGNLFATASASHVYAVRVSVSISNQIQNLGPIPWEDWGPCNTRCFKLGHFLAGWDYSRFVHGERVVWQVKDENTRPVTQIMDFSNRCRQTDGITSTSPESLAAAGPVPQYVTRSESSLSLPQCYAEPIISRLPYRTVPMPGAKFQGDEYILDEQGILQKKMLPVNTGIERRVTIFGI
ncbi:hypothetical protein EVG20_g6685 [Dentipellis fragilis]|uniref:Uncharacterized protein n=1 Tax=Dentipellis fragilis TaxID=205917 RepID=A0A4Y9YIY7_9AGAM|nr:hypothetical protein EVG20_g6685 [Dentipellis fragilis]